MSFQVLYDELKTHKQLNRDDLALIEKAYRVAETAHDGQFRHSGDPYITHCVEVARYLARWRLDPTSIVAGLLHDTVEDTPLTLKEIEHNFGSKVAFIVDGVSKIGRQVRYHGNTEQIETLRKMILSLAKDVRVVFVKLADRLHNMETLSASPIISHRRRALETIEIYAPLAYRLGMSNVSGLLEDLAFPYIYPKEYEWLRTIVADHLNKGQQ